ncbi:MAG TPA: CHAT domain-containing tetratricopeptide repeat protein [Terracidiphilus sp.]
MNTNSPNLHAYEQALHIQDEALGADHPEVETTVSNLAVLYDAQGKYAEAAPYFQRAADNLFRQFQYSFTYMTEKDRLSFLKNVEKDFSAYFSFIYRNHLKDLKLNGAMYDLLLWEKGFVAVSIAGLRQQIEASGDAEAIAMLGDLSAKRTQLAALLGSEPGNRDVWRRQIDQLQSEAAGIEKELVARSAVFRQHRDLERATWQQVRDRLHRGEAAVEFARFHYFDNGWQDRWLYVALVVRPDMQDQPQFIDLGEEGALESAARSELQDSVAARGVLEEPVATIPGEKLYPLLWKPLERALGDASRVYVAPDGILNRIPLGIIPTAAGQLLMERYDLRLVLSTKDLLHSSAAHRSGTALLIGDPEFSLTNDQERTALRTLGLPTAEAGTIPAIPADSARRAQTELPRLPGTGEEVASIAGMMRRRGWKSTVRTQAFALKSTLQASGSPLVLHLATHGFFMADQHYTPDPADSSQMEDPMLRSGLYFAGANRTLAGDSVSDLDNGVLTALEAANLHLQGTELVVLSACDTGRGEIEDGEGVFGLRRALQEAGAQAVLMSLWSVPDRETQALMRQFYSRWLSGVEMHKAFKEAQLRVRETVKREHGGRDLPYYWGAFVLVGR